MQKRALKNLLHGWLEIDSSQDRPIANLSTDTRRIQPGDVFVALKGCRQEGREFIAQAIDKGAVAILCDRVSSEEQAEISTRFNQYKIPLFFIEKLDEKIGEIAAKFYDYPAKKLTIVGVTGTNGKTSCTQWIAKALNTLHIPSGVIGTLGYGFPHDLKNAEYTTPFAIDLQRMLAEFCDAKAKAVAMEVSSHGLAQNRVAGVEFDLAVFTNLTHDHLDYHGDVAHYASAKKRLFAWPGLQQRVLNLDDAYGQAWFEEFSLQKPCYGYSLLPNADELFPKDFLVYAQTFSLSNQGIKATVVTPWGDGVLNSPLLGRFNLSNLLAVLASLCLMDIAFNDALAAVSRLESLPGRMQVMGGKEQPTVVVDYSHTPDSLLQALKSLREHCVGKLWCVFGCGGDRDKTKRPIMAKIAEEYADYVVITDDNPRHENAKLIVADIIRGLNIDSTAVIEHDRRKAILHAITSANSGDIVLVAGKGHELYQQVGDEKIPFNDVAEAQLALNSGSL